MATALQAAGPLTTHTSTPFNVLTTPPSPSHPLCTHHLHWALNQTSLHPTTTPITVKQATSVLHRPPPLRDSLFTDYVRLALASTHPTPSSLTRAVAQFKTKLAAVWKIPCDNQLKEILWLLAHNAMPDNHVPSSTWTCPCTSQPVASTHRQHTFWECPVARAVREQLTHSMPGVDITQSHVWLLQPPSQQLDVRIWCVVCLAVLQAMSFGHKHLWRQHLHEHNATAPAADPVHPACTLSANYFWSTLQAFTFSADVAAWLIGPDHPFICASDQALRIVMPAEP